MTLPGMWGGQFGIDIASPQLAEAFGSALADPFVSISSGCTSTVG